MNLKTLFIYASVIITASCIAIQAAEPKPKIICTAQQLYNDLAGACHLSSSNQANLFYRSLLHQDIFENAELGGEISIYNMQAIILKCIWDAELINNQDAKNFLSAVIHYLCRKYKNAITTSVPMGKSQFSIGKTVIGKTLQLYITMEKADPNKNYIPSCVQKVLDDLLLSASFQIAETVINHFNNVNCSQTFHASHAHKTH